MECSNGPVSFRPGEAGDVSVEVWHYAFEDGTVKVQILFTIRHTPLPLDYSDSIILSMR